MSGLLAWTVICGLSVLVITTLLVFYYARPKTPSLVLITVWVSWLLTFSVVWVVPIDLVHEARDQLDSAWSVLYWSSFFLTWLVIPLQQGYYDAGEFTFFEKLKASLRVNALFYGIAGALFVIFLIYIAIAKQLGGNQIVGFAIAMANTWGLLLGILLLGYGLIEIPRKLWYSGDRGLMLKKAQWQVSQVYTEVDDTKDRVYQTLRLIEWVDGQLPRRDPLRPLFEIVLDLCPVEEDLDFTGAEGAVASIEQLPIVERIKRDPLTIKSIAALHYHVKTLVWSLWLVEARWRDAIDEALEIERLCVERSSGSPPPGVWAGLVWRYQVHWAPFLHRVAAVLCMMMSAILIWCEMTIVSGPNLSPLAAIYDKTETVFATQIVGLIPFTYLCGCAFYTLFRMRLSRYYQMHGKRRTGDQSLLFNASYMLRLAIPVGFNFIALLRVKDTAFQEVVGKMESVPFFGKSFNDYFPLIISIFCLATLFNVFGRVLRCLHISRFEYSAHFDDDNLMEGKMLLRKEKRARGIAIVDAETLI